MASPSVSAVASTSVSAASATWTVNLPAVTAADAGKLMFMFIRCGLNKTTSPPTGWNQIGSMNNEAGQQEYIWWHRVTGSEGSTVSVGAFTGSQKGAVTVLLIDGAADPNSKSPDNTSSTSFTGTANTHPDPGSVSMSPTCDALYIAFGSWVQNTGVTTYPSGYTGAGYVNSGAASTADCSIATPWKQVTASSADNPGQYTIATSRTWTCRTVGVFPGNYLAASVPLGPTSTVAMITSKLASITAAIGGTRVVNAQKQWFTGVAQKIGIKPRGNETVDKVFSFNRQGLEKLTDIDNSWNQLGIQGDDGNPAPCLKWTNTHAAAGADYEEARQVASGQTWENWGVPGGAQVVSVELVSLDDKVVSVTDLNAHALQYFTIRDDANADIAVLTTGAKTLRTTPGGWQTNTSGYNFAGAVAITGSATASNTPIRFAFAYYTDRGAAPNIDYRMDNITLRITYTNPSPDTFVSAIVSKLATITKNLGMTITAAANWAIPFPLGGTFTVAAVATKFAALTRNLGPTTTIAGQGLGYISALVNLGPTAVITGGRLITTAVNSLLGWVTHICGHVNPKFLRPFSEDTLTLTQEAEDTLTATAEAEDPFSVVVLAEVTMNLTAESEDTSLTLNTETEETTEC